MKTLSCWAFLALSALCLGTTFCLGQSPADSKVLPSTQPRLLTLTEALRASGIDTAPASLIAALKNNDPYLRSLAAHKLAEDRIREAIPLIESALAAEANPRARIGLAGALAAFDDPKGVEQLQAICSDSTLPIAVTIESATYLEMAHFPSAACVDTILNALKIDSSAPDRDSAISVLAAIYREASPDQASRILVAIEGLLKDPAQQMNVHLMASHALAQIGASSSIGAFNVAILRERDPNMKAWIQADLDTLKKRQ
jgi:HEAT repeat protein